MRQSGRSQNAHRSGVEPPHSPDYLRTEYPGAVPIADRMPRETPSLRTECPGVDRCVGEFCFLISMLGV